jgi:glyoxylase-like metal-dependent hydrolase (beta-lactamase superfamily II)
LSNGTVEKQKMKRQLQSERKLGMKFKVIRLTLGPLPNNVYLLGDREAGQAVVIDPSFESRAVLDRAKEEGWKLNAIWLTHAHFDHIAGVGEITSAYDPPLPIGLHPADADWYARKGGAAEFGLSIPQLPEPTLCFEDGMSLSLVQGGPAAAAVLYAPGHSLGHVMFYCSDLRVLFCGDVIFRMGVGRTDLQGGDRAVLLQSIRQQVFTLPDETRLLPGHGPESTVGYEKDHNPFLS